MGKNDCHVDPIDIMREWVSFGDAQGNPYMRFMAYWVVFNMLYEEYKEDGKSEFNAIWTCFKQYSYEISHPPFRRYKPFNSTESQIFVSDKAKKLYRGEDDDPDGALADLRAKKPRALLHAVYRVRCNFFHGNKQLGDPEDREFVTSGAMIIRKYLGTLGYFPPIPEGWL